MKIAVRRDWFNPKVKHNSARGECKQASTPLGAKKKADAITSSGDDIGDGGEDQNTSRALLGDFSPLTRRLKANSEFRKLYRCNIPMYQKSTDAMCGKVYTKRCKIAPRRCEKHTKNGRTQCPSYAKWWRQRFNPSVKTPLISDQRAEYADRQLDTSGNVLEIKKIAHRNNYAMSGICFPSYLKTLLYGYALCILKDDVSSQRLARIPHVGVVFLGPLYARRYNTTTSLRNYRRPCFNPTVKTAHRYATQTRAERERTS